MAKVKEAQQETPEDNERAVAIVPEAIQEEYRRCPALVARYSRLYAEAAFNLQAAEDALSTGKDRLRVEREVLEAKLAIRVRAELSRAGKPTEDAIKSAIRADPEYTKIHEDEIAATENLLGARAEAELDKRNAGAALAGVEAKRDMLVSLGAHIRSEMEAGISIRDRR